MKIRSSVAAVVLSALALSACSKGQEPAADPSTEAEAPVEAEPEPAPLAAPEAKSESYFVEGVAGGAMISTLEVQAEVISVDQEKREAVLRGPQGNGMTVRVGEGAVNFYQVKAGDRVNVAMARELVIYVPEDHPEAEEVTEAEDGAVAGVATAEEGAAPGGVVVASTKVTATIKSLDMEARKATVTFEDESEETFDVRPDVKMENYKAGQEVVFLVTELLAMEVEKL